MPGLSPSPYGSLFLYTWNHHRVVYALFIYKTQRPKKRNRNKFLFEKIIISRYLLREEADPFVRGQDRDANGKFVESEGAKNRRVIVMDANDPIAQELLKA